MLRDYNAFFNLVFNKMNKADYTKHNSDITHGFKLAKALGLTKNECPLVGNQLQRKETANKLKEKLVILLCKTIRREN